jgi:thioredoxin reductase (NADPH)
MENYDIIIIGAGGTGLAAAMYAARLGQKTLVFGKNQGSELPIGGVITTTNIVENYPGFQKLTGTELAKKIEDHARSYDLVTIKEEPVTKVTKKGEKNFEVVGEKETYNAKAVIFATGTKWKKLDVPGSKEFENKGVNYCALCDGPLFKKKVVALVGGSDSAAKDALVLAEYCEKVYIIYRGEKIHPEPINLKRIEDNKKIEIINNTNIIEIKGKTFVEKIILDKHYKKSKNLTVSAVFVAIGHIILSDLAKEMKVKTNKVGEIITNKLAQTSLNGVFAAGDVSDGAFKQLITGVAEGCTASYAAYEYISKKQ